MSYVCFNRIAVTGPRPNVLGFRDDARRRLRHRLRETIGRPSIAFSLEGLFRKNHLPAPSKDGIPCDVWHYFSSAGRVAEWNGYARVVYGLEIKNYEVYELLAPLSGIYSDLCFVDSQICLDSGEIMAAFVARGRCSKSLLPEARCNAH